MLKKLLVLLVVATLVVPSAALAAGKPDFVQNNDKGGAEQKAYKNERTESSNYGKSSRTRTTSTEVTQPEEETVDGDEPANRKGRTEEMRLKAQQEREEAKQRREEAKQKAKEHVKDADEDLLIDEPEGSDEDSDTPRGGGVLKAMKKIVDKLTSWEEMGKAPGNALNALKAVVNKFALWFGLELPYQDVNGPAEFEEPRSDEGAPNQDETTYDSDPDEVGTTDPALDEESSDGSGESGEGYQLSE